MKDVKLSHHDAVSTGDKGYIGADVQLDLFETAHIRLECPYRVNQKDSYRSLLNRFDVTLTSWQAWNYIAFIVIMMKKVKKKQKSR